MERKEEQLNPWAKEGTRGSVWIIVSEDRTNYRAVEVTGTLTYPGPARHLWGYIILDEDVAHYRFRNNQGWRERISNTLCWNISCWTCQSACERAIEDFCRREEEALPAAIAESEYWSAGFATRVGNHWWEVVCLKGLLTNREFLSLTKQSRERREKKT